jgi:hypothetical protein
MSSNLTKYHICREVMPTINLRLCRIVSCGSAGHPLDAGGQVSPSGVGEDEDRTIGINGFSHQYRIVLRGRFHA